MKNTGNELIEQYLPDTLYAYKHFQKTMEDHYTTYASGSGVSVRMRKIRERGLIQRYVITSKNALNNNSVHKRSSCYKLSQRKDTRAHTKAIYKGIDRQSHVTSDIVSIYQRVKHNRSIDTITEEKQEYLQLNFKIIVQDRLTVYLYSQYKI